MNIQVAIIGAGMAGLAAARALLERGITCTIFEKSRAVGGRVATRREGDCRFDHGAQLVKAPTADLLTLVEESVSPEGAPAYDLVRPVGIFTADGRIAAGDPTLNAEPKWCWPGGLNSFAKAMARDLPVHREVAISRLVAGPGYLLYDAAGASYGPFEAVLLTPPAPQTAAILAASLLEAHLKTDLLDELGRASYRRCTSITLAYPQRPLLPWFALVNVDRQHPIAWLACEHDKAGHAPEGYGLFTAQMSHAWSVANYEALERRTYSGDALPPSLNEAHRLLTGLAGILPVPLWANVQHWRYALPDTFADFALLNDTGTGLFFAGDYLAGLGRVHLAIESGWRVADRIAATV